MNEKLRPLKYEDIKAGTKAYVEVELTGELTGVETLSYISYDSSTHKSTNISRIDSVFILDKPKYDPNRRFKKGDEVRIREDLRGTYEILSKGKIYILTRDEDKHGFVDIGNNMGWENIVHHTMIDLVRPVDAVEPIFIINKPKYDLNRRYKKGDEVKLRTDYRGLADHVTKGKIYVIAQNEATQGMIEFHDNIGKLFLAIHTSIELVRPIEEIEAENPYQVFEQGEIHVAKSISEKPYVSFDVEKLGRKSAYQLANDICRQLNTRK